MATFRTRLDVPFGAIEFDFASEGELIERIQQARDFATKIASLASDFVVSSRQSDDPFSDLRTITSGKLKLLKIPGNKGDLVRLAVTLAPSPPTWTELVEATGVSNPAAYVKKGELVKDSNGRYSLEARTRQYVMNELLPSLRKHT